MHAARPTFTLTAILTLVGSLPLLAQVPNSRNLEPSAAEVPTVDNSIRLDLERVQQFLADQQWDEAIETLRRRMEEDGDKLILVESLGPNPRYLFETYLPLRAYCQILLVNLAESAPEALALYRRRVDPLAERWYQEALAARDELLLKRIVDQMFASSYTDDALWALGELALQNGQTTRARGYWERLDPQLRGPLVSDTPAPRARPLWLAARRAGDSFDPARWAQRAEALPESWLAYPDTNLSLAEIRARLVLVSILEGNRERAEIELNVYRTLHPMARGQLGGQQGVYAELLTKLLDESGNWPVPRPVSAATSDPVRPPVFPSAPSGEAVDVSGHVVWSLPLPVLQAPTDNGGQLRVAEQAERMLSYYPVVHGGLVLLNGPREIQALDLRTGEPAFGGADLSGAIYRPAMFGRDAEPARASGVLRYTVTVHNGHLFARVHNAEPRSSELLVQDPGLLVGLDLAREGKLLPFFPIQPDGPEWSFVGVPTTDGHALYVVMRHQSALRTEHHVACYSLQTGQLRWRRYISAAESLQGLLAEAATASVLTLHEGMIYYNTNAGTVAALEAESGQLLWLMRYPRSIGANRQWDGEGRQRFRHLNPCLVVKDLVVVAPADSDRIFAIDAVTGQLLWATPPGQAADAVHLLGVQGHQLVVSGDFLYWLDVFSGQLLAQFPPPQRTAPGHAAPDPEARGRGLLADGYIYWPTQDRIFVFQAQPAAGPSGFQPVPVRMIDLEARGLQGGHLVLADQVLLIATADRLVALQVWK